jgi:lysophospholipase L1-like esterase
MTTTTVSATYLDPSEAPCTGRVVFRLVATTYHDGLDAIFPTVPVTGVLDADGEIAVELEPTSGAAADFDSDTMTYQVTERINGTERDAYYVDIPTAASVDLGTLVTYDEPLFVTRQLVTPDLSALGFVTDDELGATLHKPGNRFVFLGDSITAASYVLHSSGESWPVYACLASGGRMVFLANEGVAGNTTTQMLARFEDVAAWDPTAVVMLGGTNDAGSGVALATVQANVESFVAQCRGISALPILATIPPSDNGAPANRQRDISRINEWIQRYAGINGLHCIDFYGLLSDPADGGILAAYDGDTVHPSSAGFAAMGELAAATLVPVLPAVAPFSPTYDGEPENRVAGGLFMTDTNADGVGNSWTFGGGDGGTSKSRVTDDVIPGRMQRITQAAGALAYVDSANLSGWTAGDTLAFTGRVTKTTGLNASAILYFTNGSFSSINPLYTLTQAIDRGRWYEEIVIPTGTTAIFVRLTAGAGTGYVEYGQVGVFNLTTMGALA